MREEVDREDLLLEAVNMPVRGRVRIGTQEWVIGWRSSGAVSLYQDADPVFQFNSRGQCRRAYVAGAKLAADGGHWSHLKRVPGESGRFRLASQHLSKEESDEVLRQWNDCQRQFQQAIESGQWEAVGIGGEALQERARTWLASIATPPSVADDAHAE